MVGLLAEAAKRSIQLERQLFTNPRTEADSRLPTTSQSFSPQFLAVVSCRSFIE